MKPIIQIHLGAMTEQQIARLRDEGWEVMVYRGDTPPKIVLPPESKRRSTWASMNGDTQ